MKKILAILITNFLLLQARSQAYFQQQVDYTIDVTLNENEKTLDAFERLVYTNNSSDTLHYIWFHLWPNAYKNDRTAFSDQLLENGSTAFYFADKEQRGYMNRLAFKVDGNVAKTEDHPQHIDIIKLLLPAPLPPHHQVTITTPFHVKLPFNFSRGGYDGQSLQVTQWYPKPAVYDKDGWHPMPYLDQGEFYSEFGSFHVSITLPANYVVAATGELQNEEEKEWLRSRADFSVPEAPKKIINGRRTAVKATVKNNVTNTTIVSVATRTWRFNQSNVHDFAWFADKNFIVNTDTCQLASGKIVQVSSYYTPSQKKMWSKSLIYTKQALRFYSAEVGEYPYSTATVVQGPQSFGGGMEYPTITIISTTRTAKELDATIAHEVGHNWFYGILATNERSWPWMDEGINSFYENKYVQEHYGPQSRIEELLFQTKAFNKTDQPIATASAAFSEANYGLVAYHKTAEWMQALEQKIGAETLRSVMHNYFGEWQFRHPQPEDFKYIVADKLGAATDSFFSLLTTTGVLPKNNFKSTAIVSPLKKGSTENYLLHPTKNVITLSPVAGFNSYDKLMAGGLITNYSLSPARLSFFAIPLYATGSKSFTGIGRLAYTWVSHKAVRRTDLFVNASHFTMDAFKDGAGKNIFMQFTKLVPGIKFTPKENDARSTVRRYIQWKTFLINEQSLHVTADSIFNGIDTVVKFNYNTPHRSRYLNQLQVVYQNSRALYPFTILLQAEQAQDFIRTAVTANYFFNYAKGGGLAVRFFAGKFSYLNGKTISKQFANDPYHLNMTGPKGYEDYTYSDYFIGRNEFEGIANQQIMIRDGGFKVRTDLLAAKVGKTDDWLSAVNFSTTIPDKINPLSILPFKIPLRVFADIGTYAEAWQMASENERFLFDAGIALPLFGEVLTVYVPIFYSNVYRDYFISTIPSNRFLKNISFSINLYPKELQKLNREAGF